MTTVWIYSLISVCIVSLITLIGFIFLPISEKKLNKILIYFISFAVGALLGDVFIHLLPEVIEKHGFGLNISGYILLGIITSFLIEKILHWRHVQCKKVTEHQHRPFAIMNLLGDGVHNFIDGLIIGASYIAGFGIGIASTIAVILHEIPQEIGDYGVLLKGGFTKNKAIFFNLLTALTAVLGVMVSLLLSNTENITMFLLPFAAGNFIYIAGSDLIPELHKEPGKNLYQLITLLLGVMVMASLVFLE